MPYLTRSTSRGWTFTSSTILPSRSLTTRPHRLATTAHDIVLALDDADVHVTDPLEAEASTVVFELGDPPGQLPTVRTVTFRDPGGSRWTQGSHHFELDQIPEFTPDEPA